ncbi:hypothetical protein ACELLULO517_26560 [Acidisoma cellulosilytica]|uniref:Uncharacterized protein n=1 Tax=Acidisoma cellulosilyticum TaxID=2802395 RepID=A0A963Z6R2_9PROT|nr:hypothetical protein [Acidisoma cellulosilyticum]MCB8883837.1 hypothetical protein [Acidisoma cellulosilyticum]
MKTYLRFALMLLGIAGVSAGTVAAAHADYYHNHKHYGHRQWVKDHSHPKGYYRYY